MARYKIPAAEYFESGGCSLTVIVARASDWSGVTLPSL